MSNQQVRSFLSHSGARVPLICGAMYPCSNLELVAAVSASGGIGIMQPMTATAVYRYSIRDAFRYVRSITSAPIGMNALIEDSSARYRKRMEEWIDTALDEGCRFFVTALGDPAWVVQRVSASGGYVYHNTTEARFAAKAVDAGVAGLIAVNRDAGGHAGTLSAQELLDTLSRYGLPIVAAGGISTPTQFAACLCQGYAGVQMGTRFIATKECKAHESYKQAIIKANADDIVLTKRVTGVPLAVIRTPHVMHEGTEISALSAFLFRFRFTKKMMRVFYFLRGFRSMRRGAFRVSTTRDYWQAGKSVAGIEGVEAVASLIAGFERSWRERLTPGADV